jgi:hypothetical protein
MTQAGLKKFCPEAKPVVAKKIVADPPKIEAKKIKKKP